MADGISAAERRHNMMEEAKRRSAEKRGESYVPAPFAAVAEQTETRSSAAPAAAAAQPVSAEAGGEGSVESGAESASPPVAVDAQTAKEVAVPSAGPPEKTRVSPPPSAAPARPAAVASPADDQGEGSGLRGINRREFLMYSWGGALGLLGAASGYGTFVFMYPRFRAGEFGGDFPLGSATVLPEVGVAPQPNTTGKFWLVNTADGPKAIYMVCTHLGCLYKWEASNTRFECPCHGSKFTAEGAYIEGPAPRSLDQFEIELIENGSIVSTTKQVDGNIVPPGAPTPNMEVVVKTGSKFVGKAHG